jgi:8-amino-7-oxononanoate synthase
VKHETPRGLAFLDAALIELEGRGLRRDRLPPNAYAATSFCSNDYLGLASQATPSVAAGSGASRLISGQRAEHIALEEAIAELVRLPDALTFTSGYAANVGALAALATPNDLIVSDAFNHASIIDGARLSKASVEVVPHLDLLETERALSRPRPGRAFVVTESYFSMDADSPDLRRLRRICDDHGAALIVDEAHALGVLGPDGRGLCAETGIRPDVLVGTFGKAFGAGGAFVAGCSTLIDWLWNRARSFVFSTGLSPSLAAAAANGIRTAAANPKLRERTIEMSDRLRARMREIGIAPLGFGHIIPWVVGEPGEAVEAARILSSFGLDVRAVRPPSVPAGTARLRLTVTAAHDEGSIDALAHRLRSVVGHGRTASGRARM